MMNSHRHAQCVRIPLAVLLASLLTSVLADRGKPVARAPLPSSEIKAPDSLTQAAARPEVNLVRLLAEPQRCSEWAGLQTDGPVQIADALAAAICRSVGVRQGAGLALQAQSALDRARAQRQPALSLSAGLDSVRGSGTDSTASIRLDWVLFDFGGQQASMQSARAGLAAALDDQRAEVLAAVADTAVLYTATQAALGRKDVANANLRTAQDSARIAEARQKAGASTLVDKLQAQTALAQARLDLSRATSQWLSASGALAVAMGLSAGQSIDVARINAEAEALLDQSVDLPQLIDEARSRHPRVQAARARLEEAEARASGLRTGRWGNVALNASSGRSRASSDSAVRGSTTAGLTWNVPLFDRGVLDSQLRDAQGQILVRGIGVDDAMRQVELQVWQQGRALLSERDGLRENKAVIDSAEHVLRVATERFRLGVGNLSDVLTAQNVAASARFQWDEAHSNVLRARLRLAAAVGRLGPLSNP